MKDATLAQGNGVLKLILQKDVSAKRLQDLIELGILSDVLDANIGLINRAELRRVLGLNPAIRVYYDPNGRLGSSGCYRACLRDEREIHAAGETKGVAIYDLMLTLKGLGRPYKQYEYEIMDD